MKNYNVYNGDLNNWKETRVKNAIDVVRFVKANNLTDYTIDWKTPLTGEYKTLIEVKNNTCVYVNDLFKIPKTLLNLANVPTLAYCQR